MRLTGMVIGISGAGVGIGRACAMAYAREGARVALTDLDLATCERVAEEICASEEVRMAGGDAHAWAMDVRDRAAVEATMASIVGHFGRIDVWHSNAGVSSMARFVDLTEHDWDMNMDVNAKGVFLCGQAAARHMIERGGGGRIINTASMAGKKGDAPFLAHYAASKFAVVGLTQAMAVELAPHGITVNSICPGFVATAMQDREAAWEGTLRGMTADEVRASYVALTPLGRLETAEDIAGTAVFLASRDSAFITGEAINVNGGAFME